MNLLQNVKSGFANFKNLFKIFLENNEEDDYNVYINSSNYEISKAAQELLNAEQSQLFNTDSGIVKKNSKTIRTTSKIKESPSIPKYNKIVSEKGEPEI